jgi:hypothetical protein
VRLRRLIGPIILLGSCHDGQARLFEAKGPQRRGEWKNRRHGEKGVEHEERRRVMAYGKLHGHVHQPHRKSWPLGFGCIVIVHVEKALMPAGLKRETPGLGQGPDQESHAAPMRPPKVGGVALGFTVLMQGDDSRHPPGLFHAIGMVAPKYRTPRDHHRHVLGQNKGVPVRHHGIEAPGRSMEKVS